MTREDWQNREDQRRRGLPRRRDDYGQADYSADYGYDPERRTGYRAGEEVGPHADDFGQADYSSDYAYDLERRSAYRRHTLDDPDFAHGMREDDSRLADPPRSWMDRAGAFFSPGPRGDVDNRPRGRRGPSDRVLWAVIVERLEEERGLDLRGVEVFVENAEVTLNGRVRHRADKRRIEDLAEIKGVRHVQNNLRVHDHDRGHWTFL